MNAPTLVLPPLNKAEELNVARYILDETPQEIVRRFDTFGCPRVLYSVGNWPVLKAMYVPFQSADKQAVFADLVCVSNAHDSRFNERQLETDECDNILDANVVSFGNLAFMATSERVPAEYRREWAARLRRAQVMTSIFYGKRFLQGLIPGAAIAAYYYYSKSTV